MEAGPAVSTSRPHGSDGKKRADLRWLALTELVMRCMASRWQSFCGPFRLHGCRETTEEARVRRRQARRCEWDARTRGDHASKWQRGAERMGDGATASDNCARASTHARTELVMVPRASRWQSFCGPLRLHGCGDHNSSTGRSQAQSRERSVRRNAAN